MANATLKQHSDTLLAISNDLCRLASDMAGIRVIMDSIAQNKINGEADVGNALGLIASMVDYTNEAICKAADQTQNMGCDMRVAAS